MSVLELRCAVPSNLAELLQQEPAEAFPKLRGWDRGHGRFGGCLRIRVEGTTPILREASSSARYRCWVPWCPIDVTLQMDICLVEGSEQENALQLPWSWLRRRVVRRVELKADDRSGASLYCVLSSRWHVPGAFGLRWLLPCGEELAAEVLKQHWQALARRAPKSCFRASSPLPSEGGRSLVRSRTGGSDPGTGLSINTEMEADSPATTPLDEVLLQPSLTKGMAFHNGFLYKLGDGLLNTTWNLRYFLLIGQTLQYYRSQHEARPRDALNLSGVTVEWIKDQSRPFTFAVSKSGCRSYCLSGCTEQEASEWMERIQAASRGERPRTPSTRRYVELPEAAVPGCSTWQEAKLKQCSQALTQAMEQRLQLRELRQGLRICELAGERKSSQVVKVLWLLCFVAGIILSWSPWRAVQLAFLLALACQLLSPGTSPPTMVALAPMRHSADEIKEALAEWWRYGAWQPDHLRALPVSLLPGRDEVLQLRFRCLPGLPFACELRRRWTRQEAARSLLCVEEAKGDVQSFEGFAIQPLEDGCLVFWLSALDLAPHWPWHVRKELATRRVCQLAGLREWLACRSRTGPKTSLSRIEQKLGSSFGRTGAMLKDSLQLQVLPVLLRPLRRGPGVLEAPADLERASLCVDVLVELLRQALRGGCAASVSSKPHGFLPQAGADFAQRFSARWAYSAFLANAGGESSARERLLIVVAFMVAGLHLAVAGFPYLPWLEYDCCAGRHTAVLPEDCLAHIDVQESRRLTHGERPLRCAYEVAAPGQAFRVHGVDEVRCQLELPDSLRFCDSGWTTVEFPSWRSSVQFGTPELLVRPSSFSLGAGSSFQWRGCSTFREQSGWECRLHFGCAGQDDLRGVLRDAQGVEVGLLHGSWLGPLLCDGEVLWKGPAY